MAEIFGKVMGAFAVAARLQGEPDPADQLDILQPGRSQNHVTTHTAIPGTPDVEAHVVMNCGGLRTVFESKAGDYGPAAQAFTQENMRAMDSMMHDGGQVKLENPAAEMNLSLSGQLRGAFTENFVSLGMSQEDAEKRADLIIDQMLNVDVNATTEEGQRAVAAENNRPYVAKATLGCAMM